MESKMTILPESNLRIGLIRKVLILVCIQLLITFSCMYYTITNIEIINFMRTNNMLILMISIILILIFIVLLTNRQIAHKFPINYILLILFTLCLSYISSYATISIEDKNILLMSIFLALGVTFSLSIYAFSTNRDFSFETGSFFVFIPCFLCLSIFLIYFGEINKTMHLIYNVIGIIVYGFYLIHDLQKMAGIKKKKLEIDDFIVGSLLIYVDIIGLFYKILKIMNGVKEKKKK